ncbi:hypothetical protein IQ241_08310 [Romeria aff. gracilis LEGE 07310]|uniref:Uncharacterized protein n=1 Tax=Vasconcelosia minhoensis LEGE 07310 TaxID=915328 RepID=A0A8J7A640_9CYAN|nr:hypothetical protein [Romeria gracilis]MBE9077297.1 hypothetical protein [Romeria aff. gracilis LEGE 07310]
MTPAILIGRELDLDPVSISYIIGMTWFVSGFATFVQVTFPARGDRHGGGFSRLLIVAGCSATSKYYSVCRAKRETAAQLLSVQVISSCY